MNIRALVFAILIPAAAFADCTETITQPATGQFWPQNGASVNRINDRLLIGSAAESDAAWPNVQQDWLSRMLWPAAPVLGAQAAALSGSGAFGLVVGSRTSDNPTDGSEGTVGIGAWAINDKYNGSAYPIYAEGIRYTTNTWGPTFGAELEVSNEGGAVASISPYHQAAGETIALNLGAGIGRDRPNAAPASAAVMISANPQPFDKGIVFGNGSISGGEAVSMASGQTIAWHDASGPVSNIGAGGLTLSGKRVVGLRVTGFTAGSGTPYYGAWNADSPTAVTLGRRLLAIERALRAHGLID